MHFGSSSVAVAVRRDGTMQEKKKARAPFRTARSRRLVEEYWLSVLHSEVERPLYHTFSDRYGGTRGIPFAARTDSSAVLRGTVHDVAHAPDRETLFTWCMEASESAMENGDLAEARACLRQALTQLQNSDGGLTVSALASTARCTSASQQGQRRSTDTGEVLRRLGKVSLLCGDLNEALTFLNWSTEADPLTTETYVLRAACLERMMEPQKAFAEYEKYLKLVPPSLEVLAHCGKCAAEAGNVPAALKYLQQLLLETQSADLEADNDVSRSTAAFYEAHANFFLGVIQQKREGSEEGEVCEGATRFYDAAAGNLAYVQSYENSVDEAVERGDYALALYQLSCLQRMVPECSDYFLRTAHVCHLRGDTAGEIDALSEALDRRQGFSARRTTLLTRGTVYADKVGDLERAIKDFTLVTGLPIDMEGDRCTPIAYMKRAEVLRRRFALGGPDADEDQEAALRDYKQFLHSLSSVQVADSGEQLKEARGHSDSNEVPLISAETFDENEICTSQSVTDALLILANGAFLKRQYNEATHYFSRAIARGWQPQRPRLCVCATAEGAGATAGGSKVQHPEGLYDQVYLSTAHYVIGAYPVHEDMFRIQYEPRDWAGGPASASVMGGAAEAGGGGGGGGGGGAASGKKSGAGGGTSKVAERKETEKTCVPAPTVSYFLVDARYCALRALEPSVFSELEEALLAVWGPYRTEAERVREDALTQKYGKRAKRHV